MTHPQHYHRCTECDHITAQHLRFHEEQGDTVTAYCKACNADTQMVIHNRV